MNELAVEHLSAICGGQFYGEGPPERPYPDLGPPPDGTWIERLERNIGQRGGDWNIDQRMVIPPPRDQYFYPGYEISPYALPGGRRRSYPQ
jgi:hypothetical protein